MKFRPLHSAEDVASPLNSGWRFAVTCGAAAVLVFALAPLPILIVELICLLTN